MLYEVITLLTEEQAAKYAQVKTVRLDWRRGHGHGMRG